MSRRSGTTLVEVLVAIFVMGIGLIALLTLFPIGMLRMARAIHDDRCAASFQNAQANAVIFDVSNDADVVSDASDPYSGILPAANPDFFRNPFPKNTTTGLDHLFPADDYGESYPILVDPIGYYNLSNAPRHWVGGYLPAPSATQPIGGLRRRPAAFARNGLAATPANLPAITLNIYRSFTLWDDLAFERAMSGTTPPGTPQSTTLAAPFAPIRDTRFSWGYTLQRPQTRDRSIVDCSVVIFDNRSLSISTTGNGSLSELVYQNTTFFNPVNNTVSFEYTSGTVPPPPLRPNDWLLDVTPYNLNATAAGAHCYWYRVVAAEDLVIAGRKIARYEVAQPIRGVKTFPGFSNPAYTDAALGYIGTGVILEGVAEVFPKGPCRMP